MEKEVRLSPAYVPLSLGWTTTSLCAFGICQQTRHNEWASAYLRSPVVDEPHSRLAMFCEPFGFAQTNSNSTFGNTDTLGGLFLPSAEGMSAKYPQSRFNTIWGFSRPSQRPREVCRAEEDGAPDTGTLRVKDAGRWRTAPCMYVRMKCNVM